MITLLHGENIVASRKSLTQITQKAQQEGLEVASFDGKKIDLSQIRPALESGSLFGKNRLVVVENLVSSPKGKDKKRILEYLSKGQFDNDLVLWEERQLKGQEEKQFSQAKIQLFRLDPVIFRFLENIRPGNSKLTLQLLQELKRKEEAEMIFYMLIRQIRLLILAKDLGAGGLSSLSPWQQQKLLTQAKYFTLDQLQKFYKELLKVDFHQKTSGDSYSLSSRLDLLLTSL